MSPTKSAKKADRYENLRRTLGEDVFAKIQVSKILVVGAGGIGCELLKNLALSGFGYIEVIDLDTIDVSNLNRQFLFRPHHVGSSKAEVAREAVLSFNPEVKIVAHHGNIKSSQFGMEFFKKFDIVINALDNIDARRHVNRLCLSTNVPLIESGTTGYLGQVTVIQKGETECYECTEKIRAKVYPICTIRSTPEKPVHCVVWAKECFKLLFGKMEDSMLWEDTQGEEKSAFMHLVQRPKSFDKDTLSKYSANVFTGLFHLEIKKKLSMKTYKGATKKPEPLSLEAVQAKGNSAPSSAPTGTGQNLLPDQRVWSLVENLKKFRECIESTWANSKTRTLIGDLEFDKDDKMAMEFVTAASNLRSHIFHIPLQSLYDVKGIAGNIIPALATTNAMAAGFEVLEAIKILRGDKPIKETCKYTYIYRNWDSRGYLLNPVALSAPNPSCYVCSPSQIELQIDTKSRTLHFLVDNVLKKRLGMSAPGVTINDCGIYEEGEDADESLIVNLPKILEKLPAGGIKHGTTLSVEDFSQDFTCTIQIVHRDDIDEEEHAEGFILHGEATKKEEQSEKPENSHSKANESESATAAPGDDDVTVADDDDGLVLVVDADGRRKRPLSPRRSPSRPGKQAKVQHEDTVEIISD